MKFEVEIIKDKQSLFYGEFDSLFDVETKIKRLLYSKTFDIDWNIAELFDNGTINVDDYTIYLERIGE